MKLRVLLMFASVLLVCTAANLLSVPSAAMRWEETIRVTPPAPVFSDAERQKELAGRRVAVGNKLDDNSLMILFSAEPKIYANDVEFYYRQENNLYYLTNLEQRNATLVLSKSGGTVREFLFLPKRDPAMETWNGAMYSNNDATRISGLTNIIDAAELDRFLDSVATKRTFKFSSDSIPGSAETVYLLSPGISGNSEYPREGAFAVRLNAVKIVDSQAIFAGLRQIKSPMEIKLIQHAIDITAEGLERAMATVGKASWEYEMRAELEYTFRRRNADFWSFPAIVGSGPNATTLHYTEPKGRIQPGDLLLMDVGAEYAHYAGDVTRTFPVNGKFSSTQAEIYQIVYDAQEAAAAKIKPAATYGEASNAATEVIEKGLAKIGLITAPRAKIPGTDTYQFKLWFMHGLGHWLGLNVHDPGSYFVKLQAGMILTNEPGIYVRADALDYLGDDRATREFIARIRPAFEKYKNIGVRIEDDMLVTKGGVEWMTKGLPRSIADIEAFMAKSSKEMANDQMRLRDYRVAGYVGNGPAQNGNP